MPNRDGTGPIGKGPRTGRGLGRCKDDEHHDNNQWRGRGRGYGRHQGEGFGHGRGWRHRFDD